MSNYPEKCHVRGCPCGYFSSKQPSETPGMPKRDAGFLVPEPENALEGNSGPATTISAPTFTQEWHDAPRWTTRYTERQVAEWWFIRGQHAKEVELLAGMNLDLRETARVARERIER